MNSQNPHPETTAIQPGPEPAFEQAVPEHLGMDEHILNEIKTFALQKGGAGCVLRGGKTVLHWGDQEEIFDVFSSTKSIGITVMGLALMDGKAHWDGPGRAILEDFGTPPESNNSEWLGRITLRQLANHTAGFEKDRGWCELIYEPGTGWHYSDGGSNWLADCLTARYQQDLLELMTGRVFRPLGIRAGNRGDSECDLQWGFNKRGPDLAYRGKIYPRRPFSAGIGCNVKSLAGIGHLYLRRGNWNGRQIIPADFVDEISSQSEGISGLPIIGAQKEGFAGSPDHYGLLWWNNSDGTMEGVPRDAFWSWGLKDSLLVVIPSLDLVICRAGKEGWQEQGWNAYSALRPLIEPACRSICHGAPYPPGNYITAIQWSPVDEVITLEGVRGDNWPLTWADDGHGYTALGDGTNFAGERICLAFCRVEGNPPGWKGFDIRSNAENHGHGRKGEKASGMVMVDRVLYVWLRNAEPETGEQSILAWSTDYAKTWTYASWRFPEFGYPCFLNFGRNYEGARDNYIYAYTPDFPSAYIEGDSVVLMRVPKDRIRDREAYEFFAGTPENGTPEWTPDIASRKPVFSFKGGCNRMDVTYNPGIRRYLMVMRSRAGARIGSYELGSQGRNQFSIYEAPEPWGPWSTVYYSEIWEGRPLSEMKYKEGWGESNHIPSKWISQDGKEFFLLFPGVSYAFEVRKARITIRSKG